jgi:hypothetical protein
MYEIRLKPGEAGGPGNISCISTEVYEYEYEYEYALIN